jgi:hypothetical protein
MPKTEKTIKNSNKAPYPKSRELSSRIRNNKAKEDKETMIKTLIESSVNNFLIEIRNLDNYKKEYTAGAQAAITEVQVGDTSILGETTSNMHAEMDALQNAYEEDYIEITDDGIVATTETEADTTITISTHRKSNISADMDNCGYCTFFLHFLGLTPPSPTGSAPVHAGSNNRNGGSSLGYPLPECIRENKSILKRLFVKGDDTGIHRLGFEEYLNSLFDADGKPHNKKSKEEIIKIWKYTLKYLTKELKKTT